MLIRRYPMEYVAQTCKPGGLVRRRSEFDATVFRDRSASRWRASDTQTWFRSRRGGQDVRGRWYELFPVRTRFPVEFRPGRWRRTWRCELLTPAGHNMRR